MTEKGLVSIILPVYNRAPVVAEAITSVLGQTYPAFELLIVDDGSTDDTVNVIKTISDKRITLFTADHAGVSAARNLALGKMRGEFVAFIDSDDLYLPKKLESQAAFLNTRPDIHAAYSPYIEIHRGRETFHPCKMGDGNLFIEMFKGSFVNVNSILVRRECVDAAGGFPLGFRVLEDYDFFLRLAEKYRFGYVAETSSVYRMSERDDADDTDNYLKYIQYIKECRDRFAPLRENPKTWNWKYGKVLYGLGKSHFRAGRNAEARAAIRESLKYRWQPDVALFLFKHRKKLSEAG